MSTKYVQWYLWCVTCGDNVPAGTSYGDYPPYVARDDEWEVVDFLINHRTCPHLRYADETWEPACEEDR